MPLIAVPICFGAAAGLSLVAARAGGGQLRSSARFGAALLGGLGFVLVPVFLWPALTDIGGGKLSIGATLALMGSAIGVIAVGLLTRAGYSGLSGILLLVAAIASFGIGRSTPLDVAAGMAGWQLRSHIVLSLLAYGFLLVAAAIALLMAIQDRQIRRRRPAGGLADLLPALVSMERSLFACIRAGWSLLTLAIFSGLIFVQNLFAQHLAHKTVFAVISWLVFAGLLLGRWRFGWRGRTAVRWTLGGFITLMVAYFGSRVILELVLGRQWG